MTLKDVIEINEKFQHSINLKLDQMKSLYAEEKYEDAADIADTINWNKIKNVNALVKAGEIYEKTERYEDSRDVLLLDFGRRECAILSCFWMRLTR